MVGLWLVVGALRCDTGPCGPGAEEGVGVARRFAGGLSVGGELPAIDGRETAGVVDEVGPDLTGAGDEVLGFAIGGAAAERAILDDFACKPASLSWDQAAALPVAADTSVRLFTVLGVQEGQTLVIAGAAGAP